MIHCFYVVSLTNVTSLGGRSHVLVLDPQHIAQCKEELCDLGQVSLPLWASEVPHIEKNNTYQIRLL